MSLKALVRDALPPHLRPSALARQRIIRHSRGRVTAGPFAGMIHLTHPDDFIEDGMLVGTYEKEIYPIIDAWLEDPPTVFIDVGAAQGYYSIGFARRAPKSRNIAFEMHEPRIEQLERTAAANGVTIEMWGECSPAKLIEALDQSDDTVMICDVEGYEMELLQGEVVEKMCHTRAIIECHDSFVPGVTGALKQRFAASHDMEVIKLGPRTAKDLPFIICDRWTVGAIDEGRSSADEKWLILTPKGQ